MADTPLKPKGKINYQVTEERKDEQEVKLEKDFPESVDRDASWIKYVTVIKKLPCYG